MLAPLVAACGAAVPQLSGRGLGHTGGTLDKLEAIPGWRATLSTDEVVAQLRDGGGGDLRGQRHPLPRRPQAVRPARRHGHRRGHPAHRQLDHVQEDRRGHRARWCSTSRWARAPSCPELDRARRLAETMVGLGQAHGVRTVALLTDMDTPLGRAAGNGLEVAEAVEVLRGGGPPDLIEVTLALAREMVALAGLAGGGPGPGGGRPGIDPAARAGRRPGAGGLGRHDPGPGRRPRRPRWPRPGSRHVVAAPGNGYLRRLDARAVGVAVWRLGAGPVPQGGPGLPHRRAPCACASRATRSARASRCWSSTSTTSPACRAPSPPWRAPSRCGPEPPEPRPLVIERIA